MAHIAICARRHLIRQKVLNAFHQWKKSPLRVGWGKDNVKYSECAKRLMAGNKLLLSIIGRFFSLGFSHYIFSFKCHLSANTSLVGSNTCWPYQIGKTSLTSVFRMFFSLTLVSRHCHNVWRIQKEIISLHEFGSVWESYFFLPYFSVIV